MTSLAMAAVMEKMGAAAGPLTLGGFTAPAKALFTAALAEKLDRPLVVTLDKAAAAEEFLDALRFFMPAGAGAAPVLYFPPWEILPYEKMPPHPEVSGARLSAMAALLGNPKKFVMVTAVEALARRVVPPPRLRRALLRIRTGDTMNLDKTAMRLVMLGYQRAPKVEERGEFSIRGGILDVFSGADRLPLRVELFGDEVESIRLFNPGDQRSVESVDEAVILPFREVFYHGRADGEMTERAREMAAGWGVHENYLEALEAGEFFDGIESMYPLVFGEAASIFDYLPPNTAFVIDEPEMVEKQVVNFHALMEEERAVAIGRGDPAPEPESLYLPADALKSAVEERRFLSLRELSLTEEGSLTVASSAAPRYQGRTGEFIAALRKMAAEGYRVILAASSKGGAERLSRMLREESMGAGTLDAEGIMELVRSLADPQPRLFEEHVYIATGKLASGFSIPSCRWAVMTEDEIFGRAPRAPHRVRKARKVFEAGLEDIREGGLVVHRVHGVGRYARNVEMVIGDAQGEYLEIEYAERQKLFLPMHGVHMLKKYQGGGGPSPQLDRMGGATWKKTRARVKKGIMEMAGRLLKIQAAREMGEGFSCSPDSAFHREFADAFEYEETEGQLSAYADVALDMENLKPMDRLVCGDVGYGKTEVAMRAAFKAVYDGRQVAVLVPTTLLARQHYQTFAERFKAFPAQVEYISRFKSRKEQKDIIGAAAAGRVDILIGTHRLLQKDVKFKNLGLVVIDEEQRFGVAHKEKLRSLSRGVDVLTLTATPIPRTLHTAILGIRDLSVIETPPPSRQSIRTVITKFSGDVIREAILREMDRGGQVFFVHNQVRSIHSMARYVNEAVPEARVAVAHGQMGERELEGVMIDFLDKKSDVLVCTTIIESGLDIPSANTIIMNRADHFGLAQLYQLRGRVGRDRHRAHSYLLIPGAAGVKDVAKKRLKAIEELSELGSGFKLAARDMEIRGAGNLLGPEQSGNMDAVGFDTYCDMLQDAIRELRGEPPEERFEVTLNLGLDGRITPGYVPGLAQRLELYNRLGAASSIGEISELETEIKDRFGPIPEETAKLLAVAVIRALCKTLRVERVDIIRDRLVLNFDPSTPLRPDRLVTAAYEAGEKLRFTSGTGAEYVIRGADWRERYASIRGFLEFLLGNADVPAPSGKGGEKGLAVIDNIQPQG